MNYTTLIQLLKKTYEISNPEVIAKQIKSDFISITWTFDLNTRNPEECIEITHKLKYDATKLKIELEKKEINISKEIILTVFGHYHQEILPLLISHNYKEIANIVFNIRGNAIGIKHGITE